METIPNKLSSYIIHRIFQRSRRKFCNNEGSTELQIQRAKTTRTEEDKKKKSHSSLEISSCLLAWLWIEQIERKSVELKYYQQDAYALPGQRDLPR